MTSLSETCRVCLEKCTKLYPLNEPILNVDEYLSTMISYCTSIELVLDEDLPNGVCVPCFKTLRIAYNFIKRFNETNTKLLSERELKTNVQIEPVWEEYNAEQKIELIELKEEYVEEDVQFSEYMTEVSEYESDLKPCSPGENITIKYVKDDVSSNKSSDEEKCEKETKIVLRNPQKPRKEVTRENATFNTYTCPLCLNVFMEYTRGFMRHLRTTHKDDLVDCNKCSLEPELTVDQYIEHYTNHHLHQCPICNKKLGSKTSFYYHSKSHSESKPLECPHQNCNKTFENRLYLKKHLETHSKNPRYICSKCGKKFITYDTFRYHNKTHDGNRSYLCNVCGRTFLQSVHLKYHMWHHTGVKQFQCKDCDKSYTTITHLNKHRRKYCGAIQS